MKYILSVLLLVMILSGGCATVMNGRTQSVIVESNPPEAVATIENQAVKTPGTFQLKRKNSYPVKVEKEGYEPATTTIQNEWSWWLLGNVVLGGIIGLVVDFVTGSAYTLEPERVSVRLVPAKIVAKPSGKGEAGAVPVVPVSDVDSVETTGRRQPHAHAIVIGIEQYRERLPRADFATHDAKVMSEYLIKTLGYPEENVVVLLDEQAAKSDLEKYVERWLPNRVEKDDSVFVYYSGHGAPNPKTTEAYLVPYDGDPTFLDATGYPLKRLYEHLAKLPAKEVVVVLDSCFSGAGGRSVIAKGMRPAVVSVENPILAAGKTAVLTASAGDQVSSTYDQKGHGLLTYFFLKGLQGEADQNRDNTIELAEVYMYLKPQVERVARREFNNEQTPQLLGDPDTIKKGILLLEKIGP